MPKRSNDFQKLVLYLNKHKHPNVEIVESKELIDNVTSEPREVDVFITTCLGNYKLNISIECIEKKNRKADVSWVEMMKAKHDKLETNKLILVSKSGFSKQAIKFAAFHNIQTMKYDYIETKLENTIFDYNSLVFKLFTQSIEKVYFIVLNNDGKLINVEVAPETAVFNNKSDIVGLANDVMNYFMKTKEAIDYFWKNGAEEHKYFELHWINNKTLPIYLQEVKNMSLESIEEIKIIGTVDFKVRNFETEAGRINDSSFIWGKINLDKKNTLLFIGTPKDTGATFTIVNN